MTSASSACPLGSWLAVASKSLLLSNEAGQLPGKQSLGPSSDSSLRILRKSWFTSGSNMISFAATDTARNFDFRSDLIKEEQSVERSLSSDFNRVCSSNRPRKVLIKS